MRGEDLRIHIYIYIYIFPEKRGAFRTDEGSDAHFREGNIF